jgi:hypothetical protein
LLLSCAGRRAAASRPAPNFELKQAILRLVIEKAIVSGHRLEIHLAIPASSHFHLTSLWGATHKSPRIADHRGVEAIRWREHKHRALSR